MKTLKVYAVLLWVGALLFGATSCGKDNVSEDQNPQRVSLETKALSLKIGSSADLKAVVTPSDWSGKLQWESSNGAIATVNADGRVHAIAIGEAKITVKAGNASDVCLITVLSPDIENPLAFLSKENLQSPGVFAATLSNTTIAEEGAQGRLFQWGRNIACEYMKMELKQGIISAESALVYEQKIFVPSADDVYFSWYKDSKSTDSWAAIVARSPADNPPVGYKANGGDPCPSGYHIPTEAEMRMLIPVGPWDLSADSTATSSVETLSYLGKVQEYNSDFMVSKIDKALYAIRMKGTPSQTAFRWIWREIPQKPTPYRYLEVTARVLGSEAVDAKEIANSGYWDRGKEKDVVRLIPTSGFFSSFVGQYGNRGGDGASYYWTLTPSGDEGAMAMNIGSGIEHSYGIGIASADRANAMSIRCVRNTQ